MNKYDEALHSIMFSFRYRVKPKYVYGTEKENFDILEELVEKATPKKAKKYITPYNYIEFECPNCHTVTHTNFIRPYCGQCGQALDWGEDDENS